MTDDVRLPEQRSGVLVMTLNHPEAMNAIDSSLTSQLTRAGSCSTKVMIFAPVSSPGRVGGPRREWT
jgi:hypothetical protein